MSPDEMNTKYVFACVGDSSSALFGSKVTLTLVILGIFIHRRAYATIFAGLGFNVKKFRYAIADNLAANIDVLLNFSLAKHRA